MSAPARYAEPWEAALVRAVRRALARFDTPAPTPPATTPPAHTTLVILEDQEGVRPRAPYASVRTLAFGTDGYPSVQVAEDDDDPTLAATRVGYRYEGTATIGLYGPRRSSMAIALRSAMDDPDFVQACQADGLTIVGPVGAVRLVGISSGAVPDSRAVMDVAFRFVHQASEPIIPISGGSVVSTGVIAPVDQDAADMAFTFEVETSL